MGFNSRLDTIQAVVGNWLIPQTKKLPLKELKMQNIMIRVFKDCSNKNST